jgi:hypothetical protein
MFVAAFVAGRILPVWAPFLGLEIRIHEVGRIEMRAIASQIRNIACIS